MDEPGAMRLSADSGRPDMAMAASAAEVRELRGAIALVVSGVAVDVVLCGLHGPETAAQEVAAEAAAAGVGIRLERSASTGQSTIVVGPSAG